MALRTQQRADTSWRVRNESIGAVSKQLRGHLARDQTAVPRHDLCSRVRAGHRFCWCSRVGRTNIVRRMRSNEDLTQILARIHAQIGAADQKAAALLTIAGVLIAFPAPLILVPSPPNVVPFPAVICAAVAAVALVVSICAALTVLFPRTSNDSDTHSLIYFKNIAALKQPQYALALSRCDDASFRDDLIAQIHVNSRIAARKYSFFQLAVLTLVAGIVLLVVGYGALAWRAAAPPNTNAVTGQTRRP